MELVIPRYRSLSLVVSAVLDRILIPLAVVVGLAGGAMIGAEIARLQAPPADLLH